MLSWKDRKNLKHARELVHGTRKLVRINRDLLEVRQIQDLTTAADALGEAVALKNVNALNGLADKLEKHLERSFPRPSYAAVRENVEVLLVAILVAMAVRTFFVQPFKIPTGSMQPTLYGIYPPEPQLQPFDGDAPSLPVRLFGTIFQGRMYQGGGYRSRGDHIFVDKISYHFRKPHRGEVIVFETEHVPVPRGSFYIKRLIGLGNDEIQVKPPYVLVNGKILDERKAFKRIYSREGKYTGYVIPAGAPIIHSPDAKFTVPERSLFVMGDNSGSSYDGRFWGAFPERDLVGRAFFVYWPFTARFGVID